MLKRILHKKRLSSHTLMFESLIILKKYVSTYTAVAYILAIVIVARIIVCEKLYVLTF